MWRSTAIAAVCAATGAGAIAGTATAQGDGRNALTWRWDGPVAAGAWMRVHDLNGAITVAPSPDGAAHVRATKRVGPGGDLGSVHFAVVRDGADVTICALWSDRATCSADGMSGNGDNSDNGDRRRNVSVTLTVEIPAGVKAGASTVNGAVSASGVTGQVLLRTVNGAVTVSGTGGPATAKTVNGDVRIDTRGGPVSASTVNGTIDARMGSQGTADMRFRTVNGSITITTPAQLDAQVDLRTLNGTITSRFPLSYDRRRRHADGSVGRGGRQLSARTVNGSITLD